MQAFINYHQKYKVQMYSCTNRDGKIIPIKIKFEDEAHELRTYEILSVKDVKEYPGLSISYDVEIENYGERKIVRLEYKISEHRWEILI